MLGKESLLLGRNTRSKERIYEPSPSLEFGREKTRTLEIRQEARKGEGGREKTVNCPLA